MREVREEPARADQHRLRARTRLGSATQVHSRVRVVIPNGIPDQVKEHHEERVRAEREPNCRECEGREDRGRYEGVVWVEWRADA